MQTRTVNDLFVLDTLQTIQSNVMHKVNTIYSEYMSHFHSNITNTRYTNMIAQMRYEQIIPST